ncbi:MAG: hypothetical protein IJW71_04915 [Clostridia bacterium]|nr:hypothetical protein [Clostridia bacterium]
MDWRKMPLREQVFRTIVEIIESGEISYSRLEDALTRIRRVREALGMTTPTALRAPSVIPSKKNEAIA